MTGMCFRLVGCCEKIQGAPAAVLCIVLFIIQAASMNFFLVQNLGTAHYVWIAADFVNAALLIICIIVAYSVLKAPEKQEVTGANGISCIAWILMSMSLAAKTIIILKKVTRIEEDDPGFMGPNALKTTIGLSGCVFLCFLMTQHDAPLGTERRQYIEELTGTVVFDILDTVDVLEVLFDKDKRATLSDGLEEFILAVATLNLLIPSLPLFTLAKTKYGMKKLSKKMVYLHRLLLVLIVNVPNLLVRMILWHGFSVGISPFCLKNIILICMTAFVFYENYKERYDDAKEREENELRGVNGKYRSNGDLPNNTDPDSYRPPTLDLTPNNNTSEKDEDGGGRGSSRRSRHSIDGRHQSYENVGSLDSNNSSRSRRSNYSEEEGDHLGFAMESRMVTSI